MKKGCSQHFIPQRMIGMTLVPTKYFISFPNGWYDACSYKNMKKRCSQYFIPQPIMWHITSSKRDFCNYIPQRMIYDSYNMLHKNIVIPYSSRKVFPKISLPIGTQNVFSHSWCYLLGNDFQINFYFSILIPRNAIYSSPVRWVLIYLMRNNVMRNGENL